MVEPRTSRINMRLSPSELHVLRLAAEKKGQPLTRFILVAALEQAWLAVPASAREEIRAWRG
jgi:uncharacterized protein (DUF1778 family)